MLGEEFNTFTLVEHRVVTRVYRVSSVDITEHQKRVESHLDDLLLMCRRVRTQQMCRVDVICVSGRPTHVIWITILVENREIYESSYNYCT